MLRQYNGDEDDYLQCASRIQMELVGREEDFDPVAQQLASSDDEGRADENEVGRSKTRGAGGKENGYHRGNRCV